MTIHTSKLDRCFWECTSTEAVRQCACPCHKPRKAVAIEGVQGRRNDP